MANRAVQERRHVPATITRNTSDHLPLTVSLSYDAYTGVQDESGGTCRRPRIDWDEARKSGALNVFTTEVQSRLAPLLISQVPRIRG